jgi:hypothetical protein
VVVPYDLVTAADPEQCFGFATRVAEPAILFGCLREERQLAWILLAELKKPGVQDAPACQREIGFRCVERMFGEVERVRFAAEDRLLVELLGPLDLVVSAHRVHKLHNAREFVGQ